MKRIHIYLDDKFVGAVLVDEDADLRKVKNMVVKQIASKLMPSVPLNSRRRSKTIYKKLVDEIKPRIRFVYEL